MKKFTILFLVLTFSILGFISGCSDDDGGGGTTDPSIDPEDYAFYMTVTSTDYQRDNYMITMIPMANNIITSLEISINGVDVVMTNYMELWSGSTIMSEGQTYQLEVTINGIDHSLTINTPHIPVVNWPVNWVLTEPTSIAWTLTADAEYQEIYGTSTDYITWDEAYADLSPSDRSFTIPANWVDPIYTDYYLMLVEMNFAFEDNLIVTCMAFDEAFYVQGRLNGESKRNIIEISKDMYKRIFN